jgi:WD40 repeat protein
MKIVRISVYALILMMILSCATNGKTKEIVFSKKIAKDQQSILFVESNTAVISIDEKNVSWGNPHKSPYAKAIVHLPAGGHALHIAYYNSITKIKTDDFQLMYEFAPGCAYAVIGSEKTAEVSIKLVPNADPYLTFDLDKQGYDVTFNKNGRYMIVSFDDNSMYVWDIVTGQGMKTFFAEKKAAHIVLSPDGKQIAADSRKNTIAVWDAESGGEIATFSGHKKLITSLDWSPDGEYIVSSSVDKTIKIWNVKRSVEVRTIILADIYANVHYSEDGKQLFAAGAAGKESRDKIKVFDAETGNELFDIPGGGVVYSSVLSSDRDRIAAVTDGGFRVFDAKTNESVLSVALPIPSDTITAISFSPDGKNIITAGSMSGILVWDAGEGNLLESIAYPLPTRRIKGTMGVRSMSYSPNGRWIAAVYTDMTIRVWKIE